MIDLREYDHLPDLQLIRHLVRKWWKLEMAYADPKGYVLDHADGNIFPSGNEFCRRSLHSKEGFRRCNESVKQVADRLKNGRRRSILVRQCHLGFDVVAAPLYFDDELVGFFFTGGATYDEPKADDKDKLYSLVKEFAEPSPEELDSSYQEIPRLGVAEQQHLMDLVERGAAAIMDSYHQGNGVQEKSEEESSEPTPTAPGAVEEVSRFGDIVGAAPQMRKLFTLLEKVVASQATVLIHGESGTGKELIARAIHFHGPRAKMPFVVQNCSAFNDNLLESALFGHVRGAFTGAVSSQKGLFETADGGTFFLDEIGDMSHALQVKLLRVLQEGTFTPVGATKPVHVDVRIVAASHKDLATMVEEGTFREDLYYRVNVLRIDVPPLRDRMEDLEMLANFFLKKHNQGEAAPPALAPEALDALRAYAWPGNIRELENEMERLNVLAGGKAVSLDLLSPRIANALAKKSQSGSEQLSTAQPETLDPGAGEFPQLVTKDRSLKEIVESIEILVLQQGLVRTHWNKSQLAKELGISRSNLIQKCTYYGLEPKS